MNKKEEEENRILKLCAKGECYYGARSCPLYVYKKTINKTIKWPATGKDVLEIIGIQNKWKSEHIKNIDKTIIPYPGYKAYSINDEIHNSYENNYIFKGPNEEEDNSPNHYYNLKKIVKDEILWFVLFHVDGHNDMYYREMVDLYAVGFSKTTNSLIGIKTQQVCHNLCD